MGPFWQEWNKIKLYAVSAAITGIVGFYSYNLAMVDRINKAKEIYSSEISNLRKELNMLKTDMLIRNSEVSNRLSRIEDVVNDRIKPDIAVIDSLAITSELLKKDIAELQDHCNNNERLARRLNNVLADLMQ